ncbi:MAG: hypothetical protein B7Z04_13655 [Rhodobacterales bacterium 32-66-9]|nr:MAG: hypothetical protein B7Z04_13655 [Rhodobacterales bacterium 32-66-9]
MRLFVLVPVLGLAMSGCALLRQMAEGPAGPAPAVSAGDPGPAGARSAAALDTTTARDRAVALAAPAQAGERALGKVVVALAPPAKPGIWLSSPLVTAVAPGRIVTAAGKSLAVELRPGTGGALLSLAGFRALGLGLTDLPEVTVYSP